MEESVAVGGGVTLRVLVARKPGSATLVATVEVGCCRPYCAREEERSDGRVCLPLWSCLALFYIVLFCIVLFCSVLCCSILFCSVVLLHDAVRE